MSILQWHRLVLQPTSNFNFYLTPAALPGLTITEMMSVTSENTNSAVTVQPGKADYGMSQAADRTLMTYYVDRSSVSHNGTTFLFAINRIADNLGVRPLELPQIRIGGGHNDQTATLWTGADLISWDILTQYSEVGALYQKNGSPSAIQTS